MDTTANHFIPLSMCRSFITDALWWEPSKEINQIQPNLKWMEKLKLKKNTLHFSIEKNDKYFCLLDYDLWYSGGGDRF